MAHGKETPRQKMIGMMYLVLTAMLALNVSAEVLEAFVLIDHGLSKTTSNYRIKNEKLYTQFENQLLINKAKVLPWKLKADEIKKQAIDIIQFVQQCKVDVTKASEGPETPAVLSNGEIETELIQAKSNLDAGGEIMIGIGGSGKAFELKRKIIKFREYLVSLINPVTGKELIESINGILDTNDPPKDEKGNTRTWESQRFEMIPVVSVIPQLTKVQVDVLNCEAEVVNYLLQQVGASDFKFNVLKATVIPNSNEIFQGNEYVAQVFLAASDTTQKPKIYIGRVDSTFNKETGEYTYEIKGSADTIPVSKSGRGLFKRRGSNLGSNTWSGLIEMKAPDGSITRKPFKQEFRVSAPNIVISPTKMKVFYVGVDNPVDISVPGVTSDKISAVMDKGSIKKIGDNFIVNPPQGEKNCTITVFAELEGKKKQQMGSSTFRIKPLPPPLPKVIGVNTKTVEKNVLQASLGMQASMPPDFDFDLKYTITKFSVSASVGGFQTTKEAKGQLFTEDQKRLIGNLRSGNMVTIIDIEAVGPGGDVKVLNDLVIKIK